MNGRPKHWLVWAGLAMITLGIGLAIFSLTGATDFPSPPANVDPVAYQAVLDARKAQIMLRMNAGWSGHYLVILGGFSWVAGLIHTLVAPRRP